MKRAGSGSRTPRDRKKVIWDEDNLEDIEAHKPTRQKITEPKTPYHGAAASDGTASPHDDDDEPLEMVAQAEAIRSALTEVASTSEATSPLAPRRSMGGWTSSEDEGASASEVEGMDEEEAAYEANGLHSETSADHENFVRHRKAHYDEYRRLKALRAQGEKVVEGTDEEEDPLNPKGPLLVNGRGSAQRSSKEVT